MRLDQADRLLDAGYLAFESGYMRLEDGSLHVASRTTMVGCRGRMLDFWLGDLDPEVAAPSPEARTELFPDRVGAGLHKHCNEEMAYLARLLPDLYAGETRA